jgi:gliding motility-associated-like protein
MVPLQSFDKMRNRIFTLFFALIALNQSYGQCAQSSCPSIAMSGEPTKCYNGSDGSATVSVSTLNPYTVTWSVPGGGGGSTTISNLSAGTYTVIVQDNCTGCAISGAYVVNSPNPISINETIIDVPCKNQATGQIQLSVNGGVPGIGYTYDWSYNGFITPTTLAFNDPQSPFVSAGTHTVKVKDANGCIMQESYFVNEPETALTIAYETENVDCFAAATGSINLIMNGTGTPPYAYNWTTLGNSSEDVFNLAAGTYPVTVTDYKNCIASATISINQPATALSSDIFATPNVDVSCFGYNDGVISTNVNGGTSPYSYQWSNSTMVFAANSATLNNIPSDIYNVLVTDANGCTVMDSAPIGTPDVLQFTSEIIQNVECFGELTGSISVNLIGGTMPYTYSWTNSSGVNLGFNSNAIGGLQAGIYSLLITDNNGCQISSSYYVTQPSSPVSIILNSITDVLCYGMNTGGVNISVTGGTPGYTYSWSNGASIVSTSEDLTNQIYGTFSVTVTDIFGCDSSNTFVITQPADTLIASFTMTPVNCNGESNGAINLTTTGGTTPYTYNWTNSTFQLSSTSEDLINFPSDTYNVVITDQNNCQYFDNYFISQPTLLTGSATWVDILCKYDATGSIDFTPVGGTSPYIYQWTDANNVVVGTTQDLTDLVAGTYDLLMYDDNLCEFTTSVTLIEPQDSLAYTYVSYPVVCYGESNGSIELSITGGTPAYNVMWSNASTLENNTGLTAGWYEFLITDNHGCQETDSVEVTQPDLLLANEVVTDVTCHGFSDGVIDITPSGGTAPYNYTWFNSDYTLSVQDQDLIDFPSDTYQLELRDSLGCLTEIFVELPEPDPIVLTAEIIDVTCAGGSDGSIDVTVTGGNPSYTYNWSNGATTEDLVNVPIDEYTLTVTDTKNCIDSITVTIIEPEPISIDFVVTEVTCADQYDGTALALPTGGTGAFTYSWSNGSTNANIDSLVGGTYFITVMDFVGCEMSDSTFVPTNPQVCINPPTAFTPNGDNYNDTWFLENIYLYPDLEIKIYNRWGNMMYEQKANYSPWNGIYHGQPLPAETYYYIINLNNSTEPQKGTVTIVR